MLYKKIHSALLLSLILIPIISIADDIDISKSKIQCKIPTLPVLPDDLINSKESLLIAKKQVNRYMKKANIYLTCIEKVESSWGKDITPEQRQETSHAYNQAVTKMELIAEYFNASLRAYKKNTKE